MSKSRRRSAGSFNHEMPTRTTESDRLFANVRELSSISEVFRADFGPTEPMELQITANFDEIQAALDSRRSQSYIVFDRISHLNIWRETKRGRRNLYGHFQSRLWNQAAVYMFREQNSPEVLYDAFNVHPIKTLTPVSNSAFAYEGIDYEPVFTNNKPPLNYPSRALSVMTGLIDLYPEGGYAKRR